MNNIDDSFFKNKTNEEVIKQISELRKNIKKKHRALKREMIETDEFLEKQFKPISDPLKKLVEETSVGNSGLDEAGNTEESTKRQLKRKLVNDEDEDVPVKRYIPTPRQGVKRKRSLNLPYKLEYDSDSDTEDGSNVDLQHNKRLASSFRSENMDTTELPGSSVEQQQQQQEPMIYESPLTGEVFIKTPEGKSLAKQYIENNFKGKLAKEYFSKLIRGHKEIDHNYGVHVDGNIWKIGDKEIDLNIDDFIIGNKHYTGTRGLYELIFMNNPNEYIYDDIDLENYKSILMETNVFRSNYSQLGRIRSNRGYKYKNIISHLIGQQQPKPISRRRPKQETSMMETYTDRVMGHNPTGSGVTLVDTKPNLIYYDDPNEIVERLRVLMASKEAGNNGHENEINAIIEELIEIEPLLFKKTQ